MEFDLTNEPEVVQFMRSSKDHEEWRINCDIVKEANNGYPDFWYKAIIQSGLCDEVLGEGSSQFNFYMF